MSITVTLPLSAPTGLTATPAAGGSLDASTTYYYKIIAFDTQYYTALNPSYRGYHSPASEEGTFDTDGTNKSATIEWTNSTGHTANTRYQILLTKASGDYTAAGGYSTTTDVVSNTFTTGEAGGYLITTENTGIYAIHSINLVNDFPFGMDKEIGMIKVAVDDESLGYNATYLYKYGLEQIYQAIVSAGFSDYVQWDGINFVLKGYIEMTGSNATYIDLRNVKLWFPRGGVIFTNTHANSYFRLGVWVDDYQGGSGVYKGGLYLYQGRYPLYSNQDGKLKIYGCDVDVASIGTENQLAGFAAETLSVSSYIGGSQTYLTAAIDEIKGCNLGLNIRGVTSEVKDMKTGIGNNWHNTDTYRMIVTANRTAAYTTNARIYATKWVTVLTTSAGMRMYVPAAGTTFSTLLYDPEFTYYKQTTGTNLPPTWMYMTNYGNVTSDSYWETYHSVIFTVNDSTGTPIQDVNIKMTDQYGNSALWVEHDGTFDRTITGNEYTTPRTTDANGHIDYYVKAYKINLDPTNTEADAYCENYIKTDYYPFKIELSKSGYLVKEMVLTELTDKTYITATMDRVRSSKQLQY